MPVSTAQSSARESSARGAAGADLTPLDVLLATMRWAHLAAMEVARADIAALAGADAVAAAKAALALSAHARTAAKSAAPYVHARVKAAAPKPAGERTHEEWLADMERAAAECAKDESTPPDGPAYVPPLAAAPGAADTPHAPEAGGIAAAPREAQPGAVSVNAGAARGVANERADARPVRSPPRRVPRKRRTATSWLTY